MPQYANSPRQGMFDAAPLPLVQDTDQLGISDAWGANWRDVYILDRQGRFVDKINLTEHDPDPTTHPENYALLKSMVLDARDGQDQQSFTGQIVFHLFPDIAPETVERFVGLVNAGFFDGGGDPAKRLTFHRIIDGFMAQGGDPLGNGTGGTANSQVPLDPSLVGPFSDEFSYRATFNGFGQLAMANSGPDTQDSQFFITDSNLSLNMPANSGQQPPQHLNFKHTIFGQLVSGFETFERMMRIPVNGSAPANPVEISIADVFDDPDNGVLRVTAPPGYTGTTTITVTAANPDGLSHQQSFQVQVVPDEVNDRPYLLPLRDLYTETNDPVRFWVSAVDLEGDDLTFEVRDPTNFANEPVGVDVQIGDVEIDYRRFAQMLADAGVKFYGAWWCPHCAEQHELFHNQDEPVYVECSNPAPDRSQNETCQAENIRAYPTWEFPDGSRQEGVLDLQTLSQRSGVPIPRRVRITLRPQRDFAGDQIDLLVGVRDQTARDGRPLTDRSQFDTEQITLHFTRINDAPVAFAANRRFEPGQPRRIRLGADDGDSDEEQTLTYRIVTLPRHGTLTGFDPQTRIVPNGIVVYTSEAGYNGRDHFTFIVRDDGGTAHGGRNVSRPAPIRLFGTTGWRGAGLNKDGLLTITGTKEANVIELRSFHKNREALDVVIDGLLRGSFSRPAVRSIRVLARGGNDTVSLPPWLNVPATLEGGAGNDSLTGGAGNDLLRGGPGPRRLRRRARSGRLTAGSDTLVGGPGADTLVGGPGRDILRGGKGRDVLRGQAGPDQLNGGPGADYLLGQAGPDALRGGLGHDLLRGGTGNDSLYGGKGHDLLTGDGSGDDFLSGGPGNDVLARRTGRDTAIGGPGQDLFGAFALRGPGTDFDENRDINSREPVTTGSFFDTSLMGDRQDTVSGAPDVNDPSQRDHVPWPEQIDYSQYSNPPTYGPHRPRPAPTGFFGPKSIESDDQARHGNNGQGDEHEHLLADAKIVHNLEHGHVWISYQPDLDRTELARLRVIGQVYGRGLGVIIAPRQANDRPIALASWDRLMFMDRLDVETLIDFIRTNRGHAPEGFIEPAGGSSHHSD